MDYQGQQEIIAGRVGQTLMEACVANNCRMLVDDSDGGGAVYSVIRNPQFTEDLFGEGPVSPVAHVVVANEWMSKLPPPSDAETRVLQLVPQGDLSSNSRLATEIALTKDLDGLAVAVPEAPPSEDAVDDE